MHADSVERLRAFYAAHHQELFTYALSLTGGRMSGEDAVHNAFVRLLKARRAPRELRPYVFRSVRNAAMDERRRNKRDEPDASIFNGRGGADAPLRILVEELLAFVSTDEREAIVLKVYSGMTFDEIAQLRGVPLQTVASWYRRGMEKLRGAWNRENPDK